MINMKYNIINLTLKTDLKLTATPTKVRGFIGNEYKDYPILHNHYSNDKFLYTYPYVQYKIINGDIIIIGIDEGAQLIKKIAPELSTLSLDKEYKITEKLIHEKETNF